MPPPLPPRSVPAPQRAAAPPPLPGNPPRTMPVQRPQQPPAPVVSRPAPDFSSLPPSIAASLAKLAGRSTAPAASEEPATATAPDRKPSDG
jgi:hypothetical protein